MNMFKTRILPLAIVVLLLSMPIWLTPVPIVFREFQMTEILRVLTSLLTIALFLERSLEVFVNTWRSPDAAQLDLGVQAAEEKISRAQADANITELAEARAALETAKSAKTTYKSGTQRFALWAGLVLGILVSAAGIRTLEVLTDSKGLAELQVFQLSTFRLVDVLLTGGLLAGGSEGIHKLTQVYTNFMEATANRAAK